MYRVLFEIMAIATPFLCIWCYRQGLRDGKAKGDLPPVLPPVKRKRQETKMQRYFDDIAANIDRYDGSGAGQKEVKTWQ